APDHDDVVFSEANVFLLAFIFSELRLEFLNQLDELALPGMDELSVRDHARNPLNTERLDFVLRVSAVDRLMFKIRMVDRHQVQRLDDLGTVLAAERHISPKSNRSFQRLDPPNHPGIRLLPFSVG